MSNLVKEIRLSDEGNPNIFGVIRMKDGNMQFFQETITADPELSGTVGETTEQNIVVTRKYAFELNDFE